MIVTIATGTDLTTTARIHGEARQRAMPWLPNVHTPEEDRWLFESIVFKEGKLLVARGGF